jgi:riboflavin biosynthesis pyrimidine reductase
VQLWPLPLRHGRFEPEGLIAAFTALEAWSVLVEGGGDTHRWFLEADLWDRVYLYRNPGLRLNGLHWGARPAWEARRERATETRTALGGDELHVFTHTDSLPPLG